MKILCTLIVASVLFNACSNHSENGNVEISQSEKVEDTIVDSFAERIAQIDKYTAILFEDSLNFNPKYAQQLLSAYEEYIEHHSFQADSKDYQFKAGELAKALNKPHVAIKHFNDLLERDDKHEKAPIALFYKAVIIGDMLKENELAITTYKEFIEKYPDHPFVESARQSIQLQGTSLEDIVKQFEKNS